MVLLRHPLDSVSPKPFGHPLSFPFHEEHRDLILEIVSCLALSRLRRRSDIFMSRLTPLFSFSLAQAEVYLALATVFRRFDMALFETEHDADDEYHDLFVSTASKLT